VNCLTVRRHGEISEWVLTRPHVRNALNPDLVRSLAAELHRAESSGDTRAVVLRGEGASFCAGADLSYLRGFDVDAAPTPFLRTIWDLTIAMEASSLVFVAALHGHAVAGGLELALACDVVLADEGTLIGDGHVRNDLLPAGGASARMTRCLGWGTANWLALSGQLIDVSAPALAGWIHRITSREQLVPDALETAAQLAATPRTAQRRYKTLLAAQRGAATVDERERELRTFDDHWKAENVRGALDAFLSKKKVHPA
jgi:enoyl-CoA hydratase